MENSTERKCSRSYVFDYLRVVAMFGVLAVHLSQQFPIPGSLLKRTMGMGAHCVQIFFVISAYLACGYFFKNGATTIGYYKRRALRILPTYYAAIIAAMLWVEFATNGYNPDIFHLGWTRYFLALNTILPSADFWQWNNAFGFWTMTDFIFFYAIIPLLIKFFNTFLKCSIFFFICLLVARLSHYAGSMATDTIFSHLQQMITWSPLVQMPPFALGMMTYFAMREDKKSYAAIILVATAMLPIPAALLFSILTCLFILTVKETDVHIHGRKRTLLQFLSKYSFHIYLTHLLSLDIGSRIAMHLFTPSTLAFYAAKFLVFISCTFILCLFLEIIQRLSNRMFSPRNEF